MGYTASKCHNRFSEVEKLRRSLSRFCYNALPNLISQYTKNRSNVLILVGIVSAKYKNYKKQDKRRLLWIPMLSRYGLDRQRNIF
jgi:hypothetical protein